MSKAVRRPLEFVDSVMKLKMDSIFLGDYYVHNASALFVAGLFVLAPLLLESYVEVTNKAGAPGRF